jgi:hypothetical protein
VPCARHRATLTAVCTYRVARLHALTMAEEGIPEPRDQAAGGRGGRGFFECCLSSGPPHDDGGGSPGGQAWDDLVDDLSSAEVDLSVAVERREIRLMGRADQERYARAVVKMMENKMGPTGEAVPGTSEYFRLASYHGGPANAANDTGEHCVHGLEAFPGWHRAYLVDFEVTMRKADKLLGGDGNIGLPYWDWTFPELNGEVFPRILRDPAFPQLQRLGRDFFPPASGDSDERWRVESLSGGNVQDDALLRRLLAPAGALAAQALRSANHWQAASTRTRDRSNPSLEQPHNNVHVAVGGVMGSVASAAFHPVFWLHHVRALRSRRRRPDSLCACVRGGSPAGSPQRARYRSRPVQNNVDRYYEQYLALHPDSHREFRAYQERLAARDVCRPPARLPACRGAPPPPPLPTLPLYPATDRDAPRPPPALPGCGWR